MSRVHPGLDGKLVYVPDEHGNTIHDSSHAGYGGGGVPIPTVPVKETIWPVAGDNTATVQAAIDKVSALPPDRSGFRGAVLLRAGYYRMAMPIRVQASGVVLRGEGMGDTGTVLIGTGTGRTPAAGGAGGGGFGGGQPTLIRIAGGSGVAVKDDTRQLVLDEHVPVGARRFTVASARGFKPGDTVIVRRIGNQRLDRRGRDERRNAAEPLAALQHRLGSGRHRRAGQHDHRRRADHLRDRETLGRRRILKYDDPGRIENVGVENLRGMSEFDPAVRTREYGNMDRPNYIAEEYYADEAHYANFISFDNVKHGWVRNATALHFVNSMVGTARGSKWLTVQDCVSREPISRRMGGRRFTFALRGQLALVQRCHSDKGRHSFMTGQPTASGNVFLDCKATSPYSSSEPHERWATGSLYDNVEAPLTARFWKNISIGWAGANTVFWNCVGPFLVQKPPTAQNFAFGHVGVGAVVFNIPFQDPAKEVGHLESIDRHVTPRSLYLTQLRDRLGESAVRHVAAPGPDPLNSTFVTSQEPQ